MSTATRQLWSVFPYQEKLQCTYNIAAIHTCVCTCVRVTPSRSSVRTKFKNPKFYSKAIFNIFLIFGGRKLPAIRNFRVFYCSQCFGLVRPQYTAYTSLHGTTLKITRSTCTWYTMIYSCFHVYTLASFTGLPPHAQRNTQ